MEEVLGSNMLMSCDFTAFSGQAQREADNLLHAAWAMENAEPLLEGENSPSCRHAHCKSIS